MPYAAGYFFSYLLRNINAIISPRLISEFDLRPGELGMLTASYLVGFAVMQLPVGVALDRYGSRRVAAALLLVAATGCLLFSLAGSLLTLSLARGFIGIGVSACLMSGFKAFSLSFPANQRASVNAAIMAAGGLGALTATVPLDALLTFVRWQAVFEFLAVFGLGLAWLLWNIDDHHASPAAIGQLSQLLNELRGIFASQSFWRFAPVASFVVGGFIAVQGLWAAYWLAGVEGLDSFAVSHTLMMLTIGLIVGYTLIAGFLLSPKFKVSLNAILLTGSLLIIACQLLILGNALGGSTIWLIYGVCSALMNVAYTSHASHYPLHLQGRANTCLNLAIFVCGFLIQWGMGVVIDVGLIWGWGMASSFKVAWICLVVVQFCGFVWFVVGAPDRKL